MAKRRWMITLAYLALAWFLMFSYQIFTPTALSSIIVFLDVSYPFLASLLSTHADLAVFICSFAWTFVLSSITSKLIFGREKRLSIQFLISLLITITSTALLDALKGYGLDLSNPSLIIPDFYTQIFNNAVFAFLYLAVPFVCMIAIDLHIMKIRR